MVTDRWAYVAYMHPHVMADAPVRDHALRRYREDGESAAAEAGVTVVGEPTLVKQELVWVPDWDDGRGDYVTPDVARYAGLDPDDLRKIIVLRWEWETA